MKRVTIVLLSSALSVGTLFLVHGIKHLPYSRARDLISDVFLLPGGLLASIFYPHGVHDNGAAVWWGWTTVLGNIVFYFGLWMLAVTLYARRKRTQ